VRDTVYEVHDFAATVVTGDPRAADGAAEAGWFTIDEMASMQLTGGLLEMLREHGVI